MDNACARAATGRGCLHACRDRILLPEAGEQVRDGDRLLFCGDGEARGAMGWTLQNSHALSHVVQGESPPRGLVWRWISRRLDGALRGD